MKRLLSKHALAMWLGFLLTAGLGLFFLEYRVGIFVVNRSYDLLLVLRGEVAADEAVIVYLDEKSYKELKQPLNIPFDRALHTRLVNRLTQAGAKVVVFDIVFSDPTTPEVDAAFATALRESGRVILAADKVATKVGASEMTLPLNTLMDSAGGVGYAEVEASRDLIVRWHTKVDPDWFPTLSWAAADFVKAPFAQKRPYDSSRRWMNYYGRPNTLPSVSFYLALDPAQVPDDYFRGKAVFVGAKLLTKSAADRKDEYPSPFGYWTTEELREEQGAIFMPGVEIQAITALNLIRGDWLRRTPVEIERAIILLCGLIFGAGLVWLRPQFATAIGLVTMVVIYLVSYALFKNKLLWWPWLIVEVQVAVALLWSIVFNSIQLYVQKRLYQQTLSLYLSPKLVKKFSGNPNLLKVGAEKQMLTILFSDIASFTSISEGLDSDELAQMMNKYFQTAVTHCIHKTDGTVVKYIGDAIFSFWNAPDPQVDHAVRACAAAVRFRDQEIQYINGHPLHTRIGLHTGVANVGNFGSTERVDYTALGENINLAARMEGLNKYLGTTLLITGTTREGVGDQFVVRFLGRFRLKGFEKAVDVYELISLAGAADDGRAWRDVFAQALKEYAAREFAAAAASFRRVLEVRPEDGPSKFYLARLEEWGAETPPADWKGEVELKEK